MPPESILELRNIEKTYGGEISVKALTNVSLAITKGAFAALIGPSGSGKSTLLYIASGLDQADSGHVSICSRDLSKMSQKELCLFRQQNLGFIFQAYNLFPSLTAVENVEYTSVIRGDDRNESRARAMDALKKVGLAEKAKAFPNHLSGGQQQRVAVARAIATQSQIIFADEPTANLDSKSALNLIDLFEEINQNFKTTFLFSTHDVRIVQRVTTQIEIKDGQISNL